METDRHGDLGELLADRVLHDAPQVERVVGLLRDGGAPPAGALARLVGHLCRERRRGVSVARLTVSVSLGTRKHPARSL